MALHRVCILFSVFLIGILSIDPAQFCMAQADSSKAALQGMDQLARRLEAIESKLQSLEARLNALQNEKSGNLKKNAQTEPARAESRIDAAAPKKAALEELVDALDQKVRIAERRRELEQEAVVERERSTATVSAGKDGFFLASADKSFQLRFNGYIQADGKFFVANPSPVVETMQIGRARPVFQGTIYKYFDFRIMPDFGGGQTVLQDLHLDFTYLPAAKLRFGKFKSPFGLEVLQGDTDLTFVNRAFPSILSPVRDVGAQVSGDTLRGTLNYAMSVLNGVPDCSSADVDTNSGKDFVGRIFAHPFKNGAVDGLKGLGIGIAGSHGRQKGNLSSFRTTGQAYFFTYNSGVIADGNRYRFSPQAYYYNGPFGVLAEYITSAQQVNKTGNVGTVQNRAWQVAASYAIWGKPSYRAVSPKRPFNPKENSFGAIEFAGRYSELKIDPEAFRSGFADITKSAREARAFALGVNWYLARMVKFVLNYEQTRFEGGSPEGDRLTEHALLSRFQIGF